MSWRFLATGCIGATSWPTTLTKPLSASVWFYRVGTATTHSLLSLYSGAANGLDLQVLATNEGQIIDETATGVRVAQATQGVGTHRWNHIGGMWYTNTDRRVMVNGFAPGTNGTSCPTANPTTIGIGGNCNIFATSTSPNPRLPADGMIAEVALWNARLNEFEMRWLAKGNHPLNLYARRNNLIFYRGLEKADINYEADWTNSKGTFKFFAGRPRLDRLPPHKRKIRSTEWIIDIPAFGLLMSGAAVFLQSLAATAVGVVKFVKGVSNNEKVTTVGVTADVLSVGKLLPVTGAGIPNLVKSFARGVILAATAIGVPKMVRQVGKITTATGAGVAAFVKGVSTNIKVTTIGVTGRVLSVGKNLAVTAVGIPTLNAIKARFITLAATALGVVAFVKSISNNERVTVVGITGRVLSVGKNLKATAIGVPTLSALRAFLVTLAAIAVGIPAIVKRIGNNTAAVAVGLGTQIRMTSKGIAGTASGVVTIIGSAAAGAVTTAVGLAISAIGIAAMSLSYIAGTVTTTVRNRLPGGGGVGMYGLSNPRSRFAKRRRK